MKLQHFIKNNLYKRSLISYLLYPISLVFSLITKIRRFLYKKQFISVFKSSAKVISIGNITSGGTGKTPITISLAIFLTQQSYTVCVSHRGYKGKYEDNPTIISDFTGIFDQAYNAGDEALQIAESLPNIPVIVGKNRVEAIKILEKEFNPDIIILDDSFQHLKVYHDLDIVVFNTIGGLGNGFVLPAGILRESISSLKYADIIIKNGEDEIRGLHQFSSKIVTLSYSIEALQNKDEIIKKADFKFKRNLLISGIGVPQSLENTCRKEKIPFIKHLAFPDHYDYSEKDVRRINQSIKQYKVESILTTEKDYTKLRNFQFESPIFVIKARIQLDDALKKKIINLLN